MFVSLTKVNRKWRKEFTCITFHIIGNPFSGLTMALSWLLIAVVGLAVTEVSCQSQYDFANPPPLPTAGRLLCISNAFIKLGNVYIMTFIWNSCIEKFAYNQTNYEIDIFK